jgi:aryl-alcohol dehydrogenase-like predicted oxidoreductase
MRTRLLGPGAPAVSVIGFGGMHLSVTGRPEDEATALRVLHASLDHGVTLLDTADVYCLDETDLGHNERLMAKALRTWGGRRDTVLVATKGGMIRTGEQWGRDGRPEHLRRACDRSLKALGTDRIDLYQLHAPDAAVPFAESVGALVELQRAGKIRWIGVSNVTVADIETAARLATLAAVQNRLNPFFREALTGGVVAECGRRGLGFLAYSPVGGGRLNRKLPNHPVLEPIARRHGVSCHAVVLAWVLAQGESVIAIPSARTVDHAVDSITAADVRLSADELAAIDAAEFSRS